MNLHKALNPKFNQLKENSDFW